MKNSSIVLFIFILAISAELDQVRPRGTKNSVYLCGRKYRVKQKNGNF